LGAGARRAFAGLANCFLLCYLNKSKELCEPQGSPAKEERRSDMRNSLKTLLLLVAILSTLTVVSFPATVAACPVDDDLICYYPDGSSCYEPGCDSIDQCPGASYCLYFRYRCCY